MKKIDDFIEKHTIQWCEKNKDKFLELGSLDACMNWLKNRFIFGLFFVLTVFTSICGEQTIHAYILNFCINALSAWVFGTIFFFIINNTGDTE